MHADQSWRGVLGPAVVAWGALGLALMLGGADARHYVAAGCVLGIVGALAWIAQRSGRRRLAQGLLIAPPAIAAAGIVAFMIRLAAGFFV